MKLTWIVLLAGLLAAAPANRFGGSWNWKYTAADQTSKGFPDGDFQLTIQENGANLTGEMTATAFKGSKVSMGAFHGTRSGKTAAVQWSFKDGSTVGPAAGTASLTLSKGDLHWTMEYQGSNDCWFPRDVMLKRTAP